MVWENKTYTKELMKLAAIKIKYPEFVDTDNIIENPKSSEIYRYLLFIPFITEMIRKDNSKSVVVILKNPNKNRKYEYNVIV